MDDKKKALEDFAKKIQVGDFNVSDLIKQSPDLANNALKARDLSEDALAHQFLKNTGIKIPSGSVPKSKYEDFLGKIFKEAYPELNPDISIEDMKGAAGLYYPGKGKIQIASHIAQKGPREAVSALFHEGAHQFDDKVLNVNDTKEITKDAIEKMRERGRMGLTIDPLEAYEELAGDHHAHLMEKKLADKLGLDPAFRNLKTFGAGALESLMKKGTFRAMAPLAAGGIGMAASAAAEASDAEALGESPAQETQRLEQIDARKSYSPDTPEKDIVRWNKIRNQLSK